MKVVLYARVSSEKQAEKDLSIKAQIKELRNYAERNNLEISNKPSKSEPVLIVNELLLSIWICDASHRVTACLLKNEPTSYCNQRG